MPKNIFGAKIPSAKRRNNIEIPPYNLELKK
jgi:hypothetical protein